MTGIDLRGAAVLTMNSRKQVIEVVNTTRCWRVTDCGRKVMRATMYLREHRLPNVYAGVMR